MNAVIKKVYDTIIEYDMIRDNDIVLIGLSGGADSVFLLHALIEIQRYIKFNISCAHLNHMIRGEDALHDEQFCMNLCEDKQIDLYNESVNIPLISEQKKMSEETCGRKERYDFFRRLCAEHGFTKIATAHNMNDNTETVIFNMVRGA